MTQTTESPSATIRRAAAQLKAGAEAATRGPWECPLEYDVTYGYRHDGTRHVATWIASTDAGDDDISDEQAQADARYIASMHPLVGLAVAEWLEAAAQAWDEGAEWDEALAVARRYLGLTDAHLQGTGERPR